MDVSVIIVNYNTKDITKNCIDSVFRYTTGISFEVVLIDNASVDGSVDLFSQDERIVFIQSKINLGFGKANNLAYTYATGKYIFLLNSDTLLLNNAVKLFFDYAEDHKSDKIGVLGCFLLGSERNIIHSYARFPTPVNSLFFVISSYTRRFGIDVHKCYFKEKNIGIRNLDVDYVTGADLFIPRHVIDQIGLFTPAFFMYFEETDLQKRMAQHGFIRRIIRGPVIIHLEGASSKSKKISISNEILFRESEFLYLKIHGNIIMYIVYRFLLLILSLLPVLCMNVNIQNKKKYILFLLHN